MSGAPDIPLSALASVFLLLAVPFLVVWRLRLGLAKDLLVSIVRMTLQLGLAGLYLGYLFQWNHPAATLAWLFVMLLAAAGSVLHNSALRPRAFLFPAFAALALATLGVVLFMNRFVLRLADVFEARYLIVLSGMLLGNCLSANIMAATRFYKALVREQWHYEYLLGNGASQWEALLPFARESFMAALRPGVASMTTMGLVSLPGMMTGQMLGGSLPLVAIKYQIAIMVAIFSCTTLSVGLFLYFTARQCLDAYGRVRVDRIFKEEKGVSV